jgi:hypothetical protein
VFSKSMARRTIFGTPANVPLCRCGRLDRARGLAEARGMKAAPAPGRVRRRARRYTSLPLPDTAWLPGRGPRPEPFAGASAPLDPARWRRCEGWLHAADLWNARCFWEAHEVLETLWRALPREAPERELLKGLIQLAAAHVARALGRDAGARRLVARGAERVRRARGRALGLDTGAVARASEAWVAGRARAPGQLALRGVARRVR